MNNKKSFIFSIIMVILVILTIKIINISHGFDNDYNINKIYVATNGNDLENDGSIEKPFKTLKKALNKVPNNTIIYLKEGKYIISEYIELKLKENITIQPFEDDEVIITTANEIDLNTYKCDDNNNRILNENRDKIACINLDAYLSDTINNKEEENNILSKFAGINQVEIYDKKEKLTVSRYPNNNKFLLIDEMNEEDKKKSFYIDNIKRGWDLINNDIYVFGYWTYDWNSSYLYATLDESQSLTKITLSANADTNNQGIQKGQRVAFYNIFEELDNPGEYYFDKTTNQLYIYKTEEMKKNNIIEYSIDKDSTKNNTKIETIFYLWGTNKFNLKNIKFQNIVGNIVIGSPYYKVDTDGDYVILSGIDNTTIVNNTFYNINNSAIYLREGKNVTIKNNYFSKMGNTAVSITADNSHRYTLNNQNILITNNKFEDLDVNNTQKVAISIDGVGATISHNEINNSGGQAINFQGNNIIIEYNEIYDVCNRVADAAAVYTGRNVTNAGNIVRNNYFHDIYISLMDDVLEEEKQNKTLSGVFSVYADDSEGYLDVKNNIFENVNGAYNINGGSFTSFKQNILINAKKGITHHKSNLSDDLTKTIINKIKTIVENKQYDYKVWHDSYPILTENILNKYNDSAHIKSYLGVTKGLVIQDNLAIGNTENPTVNNCDELKYILSNGDTAKNIFNLRAGNKEVDSTIDIHESNKVTFYKNPCHINTRYYHYGEQDAYTTNKDVFKDYNNKNYGLNLEKVHEYIPEFEDVHFNRMGINKIIEIKLNVDKIKKEYIQNYEKLDITGGLIVVTYSNGEVKNINLKDAKITGFDNSKIGKKTLKVDYQGEEAEFEVEIVEKSIDRINILREPNKKTYVQNIEMLDLSGGVLEIIYNDESKEEIDLSKTNISGFNNKNLGNKILEVEYKNHKTQFEIEIVLKKATSAKITKYPSKKEYIQSYENLDLTGGELEVKYNDGSKEIISFSDKRITVNGFNNNVLGKNEITVNIQNITIKYNVEIVAKKAISAKITKYPSKKEYIQNYENLDLTGGELEVKYNDGSKEIISFSDKRITVNGFNNNVLGKNEITVSIQSISIKYNVEIVSKKIESISILNLPNKLKYIQNMEKLDLTGGIIKVIYNDNSTDEISMTNKSVTSENFNNNKLGYRNIIISYQGKKIDFYIQIISARIKEIKVTTLPLKMRYIKNQDELDLTGGKLQVIFENNTVDFINMTNEQILVEGYDNKETGEKLVLLNYLGQQTSFEIEVIEKSISGIKLIKLPVKKQYIQYYEDIDLTGGILEITYNDNTKDKVSLTNSLVKVEGYNNIKVGTKNLRIKYKDFETSFEVEIIKQERNNIFQIFNNTKFLYSVTITLFILSAILIFIILKNCFKEKQIY